MFSYNFGKRNDTDKFAVTVAAIMSHYMQALTNITHMSLSGKVNL